MKTYTDYTSHELRQLSTEKQAKLLRRYITARIPKPFGTQLYRLCQLERRAVLEGRNK